MARCWPDVPNHISTLYNVGPKKTCGYMAKGVHTIEDLPPQTRLPPAAQRQLKALEEGRLIVEQTLSAGLVIVDGQVASVEIARLLFVAHKIPEDERDRMRDLLEYCKQDTWATVKLVERLRELAAGCPAICGRCERGGNQGWDMRGSTISHRPHPARTLSNKERPHMTEVLKQKCPTS